MSEPEPLPIPVVEFSANNPHSKASVDDGRLIIDKAWGYDDLQFSFASMDTGSIAQLSYLMIIPQLDALHHLDINESEFIFGFLNPKDRKPAGYIDRAFRFHFQGAIYECSFREPSRRLFTIAANYRRLPSDKTSGAATQLMAFRDFQQLEALPAGIGQYFVGRVPRSFFIKPSIPLKEVDWEVLIRHLNLLMVYYDRNSPRIVYRARSETLRGANVEALRYVENNFPSELVFKPIDDILMRLIEVARESEPRFSFIYCYQIFEYAAFYFVDAKTKSALARILRSPSFISNADDRMSELFALLTEAAQNDDVRIKRVIEEYCDPRVLWNEIKQNIDFFSNDFSFDGGFVHAKLISPGTTEESWCPMWAAKVFELITKVRNCLVHAREKRESRVILPGPQNDQTISKLLPLVLRMAEQIVFHGEKG